VVDVEMRKQLLELRLHVVVELHRDQPDGQVLRLDEACGSLAGHTGRALARRS